MTALLKNTDVAHKVRFEAARWLTERGWGKAVESAEPVRYSNSMDEMLGMGPFNF